jgi:putative protein-disulfide isomerase
MTTPQGSEPRFHFLYFADPMCSWCYGFSPVIRQLMDAFDGRVGLRLVMGGLRAGNELAMRGKDRAYIRDAWTRVSEASGQPFDFSFFERETFTYDTEPACRAVVTMHHVAPGDALAFLEAVSQAFYAQNRDTTDLDVLAGIAAEHGQDRASFGDLMASGDMRAATLRDFLFTQQSGVHGFPCLLIGNEADGYSLITNGFRPIDGTIEGIEGWLGQAEAA